MIIGYFRDFGVLRETRKEYWGIQIINFLDCTAYFGLLTIAAVFLSDDLGMSDRGAGYTITLFTSAVSLLLMFSGMATDWLGIRRSLNVVLGGQLVLRLAMLWVGLTRPCRTGASWPAPSFSSWRRSSRACRPSSRRGPTGTRAASRAVPASTSGTSS